MKFKSAGLQLLHKHRIVYLYNCEVQDLYTVICKKNSVNMPSAYIRKTIMRFENKVTKILRRVINW